MTEAIGIEQFPHVQADIAEVIVALEQSRALVRAAEADAAPNAFGVMTPRWEPLNACRNWYPKTYQRFPEILRKLGASGLMALPTEADVEGAAHDDIEAYLQSATLTAPSACGCSGWRGTPASARSPAARRSTSTTSSATRSAWPARSSTSYDREPYKARVREFLARADEPVATA